MYYTYMLRCSDNSIYTGITTDIDKRIYEHKNKTKECARYTRNHDFKKMEIVFISDSRSTASKLEYYIKRLRKQDKEKIINSCDLDVLKDKIDIQKYVIKM